MPAEILRRKSGIFISDEAQNGLDWRQAIGLRAPGRPTRHYYHTNPYHKDDEIRDDHLKHALERL